ncbi:hypothetical protein CRYO30217_01978 [Parvicella tangerina]|uniref:M23ase beta-sheet core domain-containing protein n=2 Tax=Parvicella tangerina TaxID=2829795 RepID=A0A916NBA9_9FLAO|nr:hypothetical protein CRYO30217_01978 [Parvicella tangerina]
MLYAQGEYEAEEFVSDHDLKFAVKQMQRSEYIGSAIVCEQASPDICDSIESIEFEASKGALSLPIKSFTFINHYSIDTTQLMSAKNPQINRLIIDAAPGAQVDAVFEGEVTSIFEIPGNEQVIMIKRGAYRMVYGSLTNVNVKVGQWVSSGEKIGEVTDYSNGKMIFEIWKTQQGISKALKVEEWIELGS